MYSQRFDLGTLEAGPDGYDGVVAYARAKRAQLVLADAWAAALRPGRGGQLRHAPGLGGHARPGRGPAQVPHPRASAACARRPKGPTPRCGWPPAARRQRRGRRGPSPMTSGFFHDRRLRSDHRFPVTHPSRPGDPERLLAWCAARTGTETPVPEARS